MIRTETVTINGTNFIRTYSDLGFPIERDGIQYSEAVDPVGSGREYTEVPGEEEDISPEEFMEMIEQVIR